MTWSKDINPGIIKFIELVQVDYIENFVRVFFRDSLLKRSQHRNIYSLLGYRETQNKPGHRQTKRFLFLYCCFSLF